MMIIITIKIHPYEAPPSAHPIEEATQASAGQQQIHNVIKVVLVTLLNEYSLTVV